MTNQKTTQKPNSKEAKGSEASQLSEHTDSAKDLETEADVLFQKICGKWYAFSVVNEDCLMSPVPESEVSKHRPKKLVGQS